MNSYSSLRKQNSGSGLAVVALLLCVVLSSTMLFSRLLTFSAADTQHYIPLTRGNGITNVQVGQRQADGSVVYESLGYHPNNHRLLTARPGFRVYDENTVWSGQTNIEIFRISYENGTGQVTVNSENGDKLLAPGTENTYRFTLENTGNVSLDYTLSMEAYFSHTDTPIPIYARVVDYKGDYLLGTAENTVDVLGLNDVQKSGSLTAGYIAPYTLEWEWPFELDDAYDTMLGNMAVDEDITLTIVIKTTASYSEKPDTESGLPQTGDDTNILLLTGLMLLSGTALLFLLISKPKWEEENAEKV